MLGLGKKSAEGALTEREKVALTAYKWRYCLESAGFTQREARRLIFMRWLFVRGGLSG